MKANQKFVSIKPKMSMAGLGAMSIGILVLIVAYTIIPIVGEELDGAVTIPTNTAATGTFTSSTNISLAEYSGGATINISTETYTFTNGTGGAFNLDMSGGNNNSSGIIAALVAEITANSTLVTAVDNGDNTTTVTAIVQTAAGNAYATTDNATGQAWGAAFMSGGITGSNWDSVSNTNIVAAYSLWESVGGIMKVGAIILIVAGFLKTLRDLKA